MNDVRKGQYWKDAVGQFRVMAVAENYVMCRRRGVVPFVLPIKKFYDLIRLHVAIKDQP